MRFWPAGFMLLLLCACGREPSQANPAPKPPPVRQQEPLLLRVDQTQLHLPDFQSYCLRSVGRNPRETSDRMLSALFDRFVEFQLLLADSRLHQITVSPEELEEYRKATQVSQADVPDQELTPFIQVQKHLQLRLNPEIVISDEEVEAYYRSHAKAFQKAASIDLSQIVCKSRNETEEVWTQLNRHPETFSSLAQKHSVGIEARDGGHMGTFTRGQLPEEMESVVFSLGTGRISPVVESAFGHHIFLVHRRHQANQTGLDEARPRIEREIYEQKYEAALQNLIQNLSQSTPPEILHENLTFTYTGRWSTAVRPSPSSTEETP